MNHIKCFFIKFIIDCKIILNNPFSRESFCARGKFSCLIMGKRQQRRRGEEDRNQINCKRLLTCFSSATHPQWLIMHTLPALKQTFPLSTKARSRQGFETTRQRKKFCYNTHLCHRHCCCCGGESGGGGILRWWGKIVDYFSKTLLRWFLFIIQSVSTQKLSSIYILYPQHLLDKILPRK